MPLIHCLQAAQDAGLINEKQHKAMLADADKRIKSGIDEKAAGQQVINEFAHKAGEKLHTDLNKIKASLKLPTEEFKGFETKGNPQEITDKFNQAKSELQKPSETKPSSDVGAITMTFKEFYDAPREGKLLEALRSLPKIGKSDKEIQVERRIVTIVDIQQIYRYNELASVVTWEDDRKIQYTEYSDWPTHYVKGFRTFILLQR